MTEGTSICLEFIKDLRLFVAYLALQITAVKEVARAEIHKLGEVLRYKERLIVVISALFIL